VKYDKRAYNFLVNILQIAEEKNIQKEKFIFFLIKESQLRWGKLASEVYYNWNILSIKDIEQIIKDISTKHIISWDGDIDFGENVKIEYIF